MPGSRSYVFTLNLGLEEKSATSMALAVHSVLDEFTKFSAFQLEKGESGNYHLQGVLWLDQPRTVPTVKAWSVWRGIGVHLESRRGSWKQAIDYATKEDTRIAGPWRTGDAPAQGARVDLQDLYQRLQSDEKLSDILNDHAGSALRYSKGIMFVRGLGNRNRELCRGLVFHGPTGTGKTRTAWADYPDAFPKDNSKWWSNYDGEETVIWDDFNAVASGTTVEEILQLLDRYPKQVQTKGGYVWFKAKRIIFTCNTAPETWVFAGGFPIPEHVAAFQRRIQVRDFGINPWED